MTFHLFVMPNSICLVINHNYLTMLLNTLRQIIISWWRIEQKKQSFQKTDRTNLHFKIPCSIESAGSMCSYQLYWIKNSKYEIRKVDMEESAAEPIQSPVILDKKCEQCEVYTITFKCLNCKRMICDNCEETHIESKVSKDHKVFCLNSAEIDQSGETEKKCTSHTNKDLQMFCRSCQVPICQDCIDSSSHHNHPIDKIEIVIDNKLTQLSKLITQSKEKSSQYEDLIKTIDKNQHDFSLAVSRRIDEAKARNTEVKYKNDKITLDFVIKLQNLDTENRKSITELKERVDGERSDLNHLIKQCEGNQRNRNIKIVQFVTTMQQELDKYRPYDLLDSVSPPSLITHHVDDQELTYLFGHLDTKNIITINQPLSLNRNNKPTNQFRKVNTVRQFYSRMKHVVTTGNNQAWLWCRGSRDLSLVTSNGKVKHNINTEFDLCDASVSSSGEILVTEWGGKKVKKLTTNNTFTDIYTASDFYQTRGITITDTDKVFVGLCKYNDSKIVEITTSGKHIRTIQRDTVGNKLLFSWPNCIRININGDIIVSDNYSKVVAVNTSGRKRFIYGGKDRKQQKSWNPWYVVTDKYGQIIISDYRNAVLHMLDQDGNLIQYLSTMDHLYRHPTGMAIDNLGRLW
ncbi:hypothetical protein KUTeg_008500, partial [Tegillarca granosa]